MSEIGNPGYGYSRLQIQQQTYLCVQDQGMPWYQFRLIYAFPPSGNSTSSTLENGAREEAGDFH